MRVAVVTEGDSEYKALPNLFDQLKVSIGEIEFIKITKLPIQPDGPPEKIKRECLKLAGLFQAKKVDVVVLLLDREQQPDAAGLVASRIQATVAAAFPVDLHVVLKDRDFENWVIADVDALAEMPGRFEITPGFRRAVSPNKADRVSAIAMLKKASNTGDYDKIKDADRVLSRAKVERIGANSRSFRHFLHVLGHPSYSEGCKVPAT